MATLPLAISLSTTATTVTVIGTIQNSAGAGVITIGSEDISFTGNSGNQFLGCVRGANSTTPATHARGVDVTFTETPVVTIPITQPGVTPVDSFPWTTQIVADDIVEIQDYMAPTNGVTGKDIAPVGSRFTDITAGNLYINAGTLSSPVWKLFQDGTDAGITQLTGDVTAGPGNGSQAATVASVGGSTAAAVHTSQLATVAATDVGTVSTIVKRDAAGSATVKVRGTVTNDDAIAGNIGEYVANVATLGSLPAGTYSDVTSIDLTAGDWDVSLIGQLDNLDTTMTAFVVGVSVTSGNSGSGLVTSVSKVQGGAVVAKTPVSLPNIRFSLAAPATLYLKCYVDTSGGTGAQCVGGLTARRVR